MARAPQYIYVEAAVTAHRRTRALLGRLPGARVVPCRHYGEVFNRRGQDFRLQKARPAWIVGEKTGARILEAPPGYGVGGVENYYFSHMLNCVYDCGYCFLQGMFRSAHQVLFVNYEDFMRDIDARLAASPVGDVWFFSGYDCDSLAAEPLTGFAAAFLPFFAARRRAWLELRTKSVQVEALLGHEPFDNCVVAFSFTPQEVHADLERGVPSVERRVAAMAQLQARGWQVGLRFDPLIWSPDHRARFARLLATIFSVLQGEIVHSVSVGGFRLPRDFYSRMVKMMPTERLLAGPLAESDGLVGYESELEAEMLAAALELLGERVPRERLFPCAPDPVSDAASGSVPGPAPRRPLRGAVELR